MKIRLLLSYKGTHFFGWQKQSRQRTVQGEIEKILFQLFKRKISLVGSGRTDAGAHALGQTAHFELEEGLKNIDLKKALNSLLPFDISVLDCWKAPLEFHARFSAKKKSYRYFIFTGDSPPALFRDLVWWKKGDLDLEKLNKMSQELIGTKDFKSFQSAGSDVKNTVRTIYESRWIKMSNSLYCYKITGSGFLKQMVRNLVGTYIGLLKEKRANQKLKQILKALDRRKALSLVPSQGLYLKKVFYSSSLDKICYKI
ncbi:MAG: tRNA pseudouridine(38-40) synthase TruA [Bdellovibrionaceae bacterium]|nr:tRNA pseudouridine(38-40) synthase TruA [Pseudobdellovibrionaceae bacterium]